MSTIQRAIQYMQTGQWQQAIGVLHEVPESFQSCNFLGIAYQMSQNWSGAKQAWDRALHYNPDSEDVRLNLGIACVASGEKFAAEMHWSHILKSNAYHVQSLINLGLLYREQERNQEAHDCWQKALESVPEQPKIIEWLADVKGILGKEALGLGKVDEAESLLKKAVSMDPTYSILWGYLAEWCLHEGDISEALKACKKGIDLEPENPQLLVLSGHIYRKMGEGEQALKMYREAIKYDGRNELILNSIAELTSRERGQKE